MTLADKIKHVVLLMFENRSFDQMLGCIPGVDGANIANANPDSIGHPFYQTPADPSAVDPDPMHETEHVLRQIAGGNQGFVSEYENEYKDTPTPTTTDDRQKIMSNYKLGSLPALHCLAQEYTVCDRWFSSVPGPTWANRFFVHSGTSMGRTVMPDSPKKPWLYLGYIQDTIYDRLNKAGKSWKVYFGDFPQSILLMRQWAPENRRNYRVMEQFFTDTALPENQFPNYVFIEPRYFNPLHLEGPENDDHPPHLAGPAQQLLATVYNALRWNEALWNSTLFVVLYDEHGGFYDHMPVPDAVPPDVFNFDGFDFKKLGVRVPAVIASPWVKKQSICHTQFDHTSLVKFLIELWGLDRLTNRSDAANSVGEVIADAPRTDTLAMLPVPMLEAEFVAADAIQPPLNQHQAALLAASKLLPIAFEGQPGGLAAIAESDEITAAKMRLAAFLAQ